MYDAEGTLLYVGSSGQFGGRLNDHEFRDQWETVVRIDVEHHENMAAAIRSEARAYHSEGPLWNRNSPGPVEGFPLEFETYRVLRNYVEEHEYAPSIDELRHLLGLKSVSATKARLDSLARLGLIRRAGPRAIEFLDV